MLRRIITPACRQRAQFVGASVSPSVTSVRHLPVCTLDTSLPSIPDDLGSDLSKLLAQILNKTENNIIVTLRTDVRIIRDGNEAPSASVHIWSIGVFDEKRNPGYSKAIYELLVPKLKIPHNRITILYHPIEKKDAGHLLYAEYLSKETE